ncbi:MULTISPECIES: DEAD/DEAH box helicase [Cyanophyceae]|uniref:DEAD/DEAH box helicase n=1 Tax=Cyanophyceae TaxID=3028117 RepID=UPI001682D36B|nr:MULTISPECIES: DEAD/DEAH box helicase [Cyanophyceae]MBD1915541.1 DEAD/DEAH box helicase [Phormidium sp. FACHB-77]MBD2031851.1 DEAD/DEAH box helicase [Phormidium sp. FACHB-322]MBD2050601.1 DEAD/DEAH box helicase [Leptolyngbya sp. FACHB-60]
MTFEQLGLAAGLLRAVADQGYTEPTPIQLKAIPAILDGQDILASAQTGTGKTAGFTLPMLQRLAANKSTGRRLPRALILTPTRELAAQVGDSVMTYGKHLPFRAAMIYGGVSFGGQIRQLRQGVDILIATPGRLLDHVSQGTIDLSAVEILVLDECDRMLDMGFIHDIRKIMAQLPEERQTLMFSATFSKPIQQLAHTLLKSPVQIEVAQRNTTADRVEQVVHPVDRHRKRELLSHIIGFHNWQQVLVFTRTKHGANRLAEQLAKDGLKTAAIHGNKTQAARARALKDFKQGRVRVLVATDVASRGIDIDQLPYVVNFEMPNVPEDYVHRIGRTGRAGNEGRAVSLISDDELPLLISIERMLKQTITQDIVPGYEPSFSSDTTRVRSAAAPASPRRQRPRRRSGGSSPSAPRRAGAGARG